MKGGNMETKQIWVLVLGALAIALVTSVISANITGNVIKLNADKFGKYQVYTKAEVDAKLKDSATNQDVLDILNKCQFVRTGNSNSDGNTICKREANGKRCIFGQMLAGYYLSNYTVNDGTYLDKDFFLGEAILGCTETSDGLFSDMLTNPSFRSAVNTRGGIDIESS